MPTKDFVTDYSAVADGHHAFITASFNGANTFTAASGTPFSTASAGNSFSAGGLDGSNTPVWWNTTVSSVGGGGSSITVSGTAPFVSYSNLTHTFCWGATNNATQFDDAMNDGRLGVFDTLTIPAGTFYIGYINTSPLGGDGISGIPNLVISGASKATSALAIGTANFVAGGERTDTTKLSYIDTVSAGSTTIRLRTLADVSKYAVGNWVKIQGIDLQGSGFPSGTQFIDIKQITGIDTGTGILTLDSALNYSYSQTWPQYNVFGPGTVDCWEPYWDATVRIANLTIASPLQIGGVARDLHWDNCDSIGRYGFFATQSKRWRLTNCNAPNLSSEMDKCVGSAEITGSTLGSLDFQTACIDELIIDSTSTALTGTPFNTTIRNGSTVTMQPGPLINGVARSISVDATSTVGISGPGGTVWNGVNGTGVDQGGTTMVAGLITLPLSGNATINARDRMSWAIPGYYCMFGEGNRVCIQMFKVLDVWKDGSNAYVQTNLSASWPTYDPEGPPGNSLHIRTHPCPEYTNLATTHPPAAPLWSYYKHVFTSANGAPVASGSSYIWGNLVQLKMTVSQAYLGTDNPARAYVIWHYNWWSQSDTSLGTGPGGSGYLPIIDLKLAGERRVDVAGASIDYTGSQGQDNFSNLPAAPFWEANFIPQGQIMLDTLSGQTQAGILTVEMTLDQGIELEAETAARFSLAVRYVHEKRST
jgi:hypothetical protein